jgi:hypothetical protein
MHNSRVTERHLACGSVENALITNDSPIGLALHATTFRRNYSEVVTIIELMNRGIEGHNAIRSFRL